MKNSHLYSLSWLYILFSALLFAVTKLLCYVIMMKDFIYLILPLGLFSLFTVLYFLVLINSTLDVPKRKRAYLFLALYMIVAAFLMWFPCYKGHELVDFFYDTSSFFSDERWELGMLDHFYEVNYTLGFGSIYYAILTLVFLPCMVKAFRCLVSEMKKRIAAVGSLKETRKQRCVFFLIYTPAFLLMLPFPYFIFFIPVVLLQVLSMLWRKHKIVFWITQAICGLTLVWFILWYYIQQPWLAS